MYFLKMLSQNQLVFKCHITACTRRILFHLVFLLRLFIPFSSHFWFWDLFGQTLSFLDDFRLLVVDLGDVWGQVIQHVHLHPCSAVSPAHQTTLDRDNLPCRVVWILGDLLPAPSRGLGSLPRSPEAALRDQVEDERLLGGEGLGADGADDGSHGDLRDQDAEEDWATSGGLRGEDNTGVHLVEKDGDFKMMKPFQDLNNTTPLILETSVAAKDAEIKPGKNYGLAPHQEVSN